MMQMQRSTSLPGHLHFSHPSSSYVAPRAMIDAKAPPLQPLLSKSAHTIPNVASEDAYTGASQDFLDNARSDVSGDESPHVLKSEHDQDRSRRALPTETPAEDLSHHNEEDLRPREESAHNPDLVTLESLAHLVRLARYQKRKRLQTRTRLQRSLVASALSARLVHCEEAAHKILVEQFRAEDKKSFATLYNAVDDVQKSCDAMRRYSLLEPELDAKAGCDDRKWENAASSFLQEISDKSREVLLDFLTQIRTNPDFLSDRIASLTPQELLSLAGHHQEHNESVFPPHGRVRGNPPMVRSHLYVSGSVERLLSFQRHDALSALIHTCFATSPGPGSPEDVRRTDIWATVCARLITENKAGAESFISSVLDVWATMRDWTGRNRMEWYLMRLLEDGAFLLEQAEDQAGTRIHVEPRNAKDSIAADEFYDRAVNELYELVDDPEVGMIPDGLLELGNAILRKLDAKRHHKTKFMFVSIWLFNVFISNAIYHPESFGMMLTYHITEYGRQKILKEVASKAMRAMKPFVDFTRKSGQESSTGVQTHLENIWNLFSGSEATGAPRLYPIRSITSLEETAEVHPYLVICAADIVTMVNALVPERRPVSSQRDSQYAGLRSTQSSISGLSGISGSYAMRGSRPLDAVSIASTSGSAISEETSHIPLTDDDLNWHSSTSSPTVNQSISFDDQGVKIRLALRELSDVVGFNVANGTCHPCAERWTVMFVDETGTKLSCQLPHHECLDINVDDEELSSGGDYSDYARLSHDVREPSASLKRVLLKFVAEFEMPQVSTGEDTMKLSNKAPVERPRTRSIPKGMTEADLTLKEEEAALISDCASKYAAEEGNPTVQETQHRSCKQTAIPKSTWRSNQAAPSLVVMLEMAARQCQAQSDLINAHLYWQTAQQLLQSATESLAANNYALVLSITSQEPKHEIRRSARAIEEYEAWLVWLKQSQARHDVRTSSVVGRLKSLRDKMWYVADVRNSSAYDHAKNVAVALKSMGAARKQRSTSQSGTRPRRLSKSSANAFLAKTEAQILDMLAAPDEFGGPNKLSDDQAHKTQQFLLSLGIENFCNGEERIHRLCLAAHDCIEKLIGTELLSAPDLWSSDFYTRDKRAFESGRQKGDIILSNLGTLSIPGDLEESLNPGIRSRRGAGSSHLRPGLGDLRTISGWNGSQHSFDSGRWSMSRASTAGDFLDSPDYFGTASPVLTIDSTTTFWSPFQTRSQSPSTSISSYRPQSASTSNETVTTGASDGACQAAKQEFLIDLRRTLTSLLISDLGAFVFARGSETDAWFSGRLGRECVVRREREARRSRAKSKRRVIEKKKSHGDLRSANKTDLDASMVSDRAGMTEEWERKDSASIKGSASSSAATTPAYFSDGFPYRSSFQRLLKMFSINPDPHSKLSALHDLEQLITASLRSQGRHKASRMSVMKHNSGFADSHAHSRFDDAVDAFKERRLSSIYHSTIQQSEHLMSRSLTTSSSTITDAIVATLQDLFRDASILPRTLFRDLQFIAAFVPSSTLDKTPQGRAFWNAGLAALGLKQEICRSMVEIADEIVLDYTRSRGAGGLPATAKEDESSSSTGTDERSKAAGPSYDMQDAAMMWTITAKEGDAVAGRELAIFYLTHPELVERTTLPLSKPRDTFKAIQGVGFGANVGGWVSGGAWKGGPKFDEVGEKDRERSDPATMCIAYHWMEASALGGDELAKKYLRQREELNALP